MIGQNTKTRRKGKVQVWGGVGLVTPYPDCIIGDGEKGAVIMKNKHQNSLGTGYQPGIMLCYLHVLFYLILTAILSDE